MCKSLFNVLSICLIICLSTCPSSCHICRTSWPTKLRAHPVFATCLYNWHSIYSFIYSLFISLSIHYFSFIYLLSISLSIFFLSLYWSLYLSFIYPLSRRVGMKFKFGGADPIFTCVILINIKNDQNINSSVVKGNKLFSYF